MLRSFLLAGTVALAPVAAFAQAPAPPQASPLDQQLVADWQVLNTAIQHVAQDLSAKLQASAAEEKQIADLQKQIADLKATQAAPSTDPAKK